MLVHYAGVRSAYTSAARPRRMPRRLRSATATGRRPPSLRAARPAAPVPTCRSVGCNEACRPGDFLESVRGIDGFGRLGPWSEPRELRAPTGTIPPAPTVSWPPILTRRIRTPSPEQRALVHRDGSGLVVQWTWTAERRLATPQVEPHGEFRIYVRHDDPNLLEGVVRSATDLGDRSRLATDCVVPGARRGLAGERLRVGQNSFTVLDNAAGSHAWFEVATLPPNRAPDDGPVLRAPVRVQRGVYRPAHAVALVG